MIDLLEIGINNLTESADGGEYEEALQYLSLPDYLEKLYEGFEVRTSSFGICASDYCHSSPRGLYYAKDYRSGWSCDNLCIQHTRQAIFNGIEARAQDQTRPVANPEDEIINHLIYHLQAANTRHQKMLLPIDNWPETEPEAVCEICNEGMLLQTNSYRGHAYMQTTALNPSDRTEMQVHIGCSWKCDHCDERFSSARLMYRNSQRRSVQITTESGYRNQQWCIPCWEAESGKEENHWTSCDRCGINVISNTDNPLTMYSDLTSEEVCPSCYEDGVECDDCGYQMYEDGHHECTWDSDDDDDDDGIHNYTYRPHTIFHGEAGPYMGFELEVEAKGGNRDSGVSLFQGIDSREQRYYLKSDGSLNYGFEIVSHPHNLEEYQKLDWTWLDKLTQLGFRSWNTSSCGLHVHIGTAAFKDEAHQIRFTKFIYDNERQAKRIAGRSSSYAAFDSKGRVIPKIKYKHRDSNRYTAVNVQNENTLEVRIFRGSLRKERVLSGIEFTHAVCEYTRNLKIAPKTKPFSWLRFTAFVAANDEKYPNLFTIINETFERAREIDNQEDGDNN